MRNLAITIDTDTLKNASLIVVALCGLLCLVVLKVVSSIVTKAILLILLVALGAGAYTHRTDISACADRVATEFANGAPVPGSTTSCAFLGRDFTVPINIKK